ncbi:MAG TPA: substrate-binding domain-containing protein [Aggregatilineales bacterium]|nr:substrate-binding domain-containing protein [Aggregatilineales bacterium]
MAEARNPGIGSDRPIKVNKEERRNRIVQLIEQSGGKQVLGTRELAQVLDVSEMTVRRDLRDLSQEGLLRRQHGGAGPLRQPPDKHKNEIGVLLVSRTGKFSDPFFNAVLEGADRRLRELGYRIAYINSRAEVDTEVQARALLQSTTVSGLILVGPALSTETLDALKARMPVLVATAATIGPDYDGITMDGYCGIRQMVDHLVRRGRRRLGFISGNNDSRRRGYTEGVGAHGLPADSGLNLLIPPTIEGWTPELGHAGAEQLMQLAEPPDAIVCASDLIAIGVIQWLHQHKYRVPEDIAVTGFDNIPESAFTVPSLTTVNVYKQLIGALAAERVVKRIENEDEIPLQIKTPTKLVIRHSCGSE